MAYEHVATTAPGTILVTGATGFIGRRLTRKLLADGHRVRCLVRHAPSETVPGRIELVQGELPATIRTHTAEIVGPGAGAAVTHAVWFRVVEVRPLI